MTKEGDYIDARYANYYKKFPIKKNGKKSFDGNDPNMIRAYWNDILN